MSLEALPSIPLGLEIVLPQGFASILKFLLIILPFIIDSELLQECQWDHINFIYFLPFSLTRERGNTKETRTNRCAPK